MAPVTPQEIAEWMLVELKARGTLSQAEAVDEIAGRFGQEWTYTNDNGNPAIDRKVTTAFRKLYQGIAEWSRDDRCWYML